MPITRMQNRQITALGVLPTHPKLGYSRLRLRKLTIAAFLLSGLGGCARSPMTLAQKADFMLATPIGPASVSVRRSLPGMTDEESEALVRIAMQQALPRVIAAEPVARPFPRLQIVWQVTPDPRGASSTLVVDIFDGFNPFWYDEEIISNDDPRDAVQFTIEGMSKKLAATIQRRVGV
jgi:hypothetical protein